MDLLDAGMDIPSDILIYPSFAIVPNLRVFETPTHPTCHRKCNSARNHAPSRIPRMIKPMTIPDFGVIEKTRTFVVDSDLTNDGANAKQ